MMNMNDLLKAFENHLRHSLGYTTETVIKYLGNVKLILQVTEIHSLDDMDPDNINSMWVANIWELVQKSRGLTDNTVRGYQSAFKKFLSFLEDNDLVPAGSAGHIKLAKPTEMHIDGLAKDEKIILREHLARNLKTDVERRNAALIYLLWATGCRISEALKVDVHADGIIYTEAGKRSGSFFVEREDNEYYMYVHFNGKGKRNRNVAVSDEAVLYANLYLDMRQEKTPALFLGHARNSDPARLIRSSATRIVEKVFRDAGLEKAGGVCTHLLRHTAIEEWILSGKYSDQAIIMMTGHANASALETYRRRSRRLTRAFAREGNTLQLPGMNKDVRKFEDILRKKYFRR